MQRGQGSTWLLVRYRRDSSTTLSDDVLAARSAVPHASVPIALTMHDDVAGTGLGSGIGGPKKQFASRTQLPGTPPQSASLVQSPFVSVPGLPFAQWLSGPAPRVQSSGPVPSLAARPSASPIALATDS